MPRILAALNVELTPADDAAPEWVELIPRGPTVTGRDGRTWLFDAAAAEQVMSAFTQRDIDLAIDWNHALQLAAPQGGDSPAAAWIKGMELREGALWGKVKWTPRGETQVINREYRFLSPVFDYEEASKRICRLVSAGLVNLPNLRLSALNHEEPPVALSAALALALGLTTDATDEAAVAAVNQIKTATAVNHEQPNLERYVPRADYDALQTRAINAEQALQTRDKADHTAAVDAAITGALQAGKITPATADYHRAMCADQAGLERFKAFVSATPTLVPDNLVHENRTSAATKTALNAEELAVCAATGVSHADFLAAKAH